MKTVEAEGFSNIALIKYMGKSNAAANQASNPSLSYTLPHLKSVVRVSKSFSGDMWSPLMRDGLQTLELSEKGKEKFIKHVALLKDKWNIQGNVLVESANNFPADCGIASSASSFAALTKAMALYAGHQVSDLELARLSRQGSGSSGRSMFSPWCLWSGENFESVKVPFEGLHHFVVIVDAGKKSVSSSEAHLRVLTSPNFAGRLSRVQSRLEEMMGAFRIKDWERVKQLAWDEFEDMHLLFETSVPPFFYRSEKSKEVLADCQKVWTYKKDGPIVTMDAGANVHLIFRQDQANLFFQMKKYFAEKFPIVSSDS